MILNGRDLKAVEITFELKDKDGNVISKAKNDENGSISFAALDFEEAGTYQYTVSETAGSDETINYDKTGYNVTITVTDDGTGTLKASVDKEGKDIVFTNKYTEPAKPDGTKGDKNTPQTVQTGDAAPIIPVVLAMIVSLAAMIAVVVLMIRRRSR